MELQRANLRIMDLKKRTRPTSTSLKNAKVPASVATAIERIAEQLNASKTEVVLALLNEGLAVAEKHGRKS